MQREFSAAFAAAYPEEEFTLAFSLGDDHAACRVTFRGLTIARTVDLPADDGARGAAYTDLIRRVIQAFTPVA